MNSTIDPHTDSLIRNVIQALLKPAEKGECRCHWLDAKKTPILAWKGKADTLILKISTQKLLGFTRVDKNGGEYWKFQNAEELSGSESAKQCSEIKSAQQLSGSKEVSDKSQASSVPSAPVEPVVEKPQTEPKINLPPPTFSTTENPVAVGVEAVQKFREKFGEFSASEQSSPDGEQSSTAKKKYGTATNPKEQ